MYNEVVGFEWDQENKGGIDLRKHGVRVPEAIPVFDDPYAITIADDDSDLGEQRFWRWAWERQVVYSWSSMLGAAPTFESFPRDRLKPTSAKNTRRSDERSI